MSNNDMQDMAYLTASDLDAAHRALYFSARAYCLVTEKGMVQAASGICPDHDPDFVSVGGPAESLAAAGERYREAYARWEANHPDEPEDEDGDE